MNNNLLLELSKYLDGKCGIEKIDNAVESRDVAYLRRKHISSFLENRIGSRKTYEDLKNRNILKSDSFRFAEIHEILSRISFAPQKGKKVAPSIASQIKKLDFYLRKKVIIHKLGLEDYEKEL